MTNADVLSPQHDVFTGDTYTYKEANEIINTIAQNLYQRFEFRPGDHFACYSLNHVHYVLLLLAIWKLKGVYVGINPQHKPG
jgi:acyl-CoA synthetase (AMP-forming)/AMP-acid ligase II